jgi:hypothetical protein
MTRVCACVCMCVLRGAGTQEPYQFGAPPVGIGMTPAEVRQIKSEGPLSFLFTRVRFIFLIVIEFTKTSLDHKHQQEDCTNRERLFDFVFVCFCFVLFCFVLQGSVFDACFQATGAVSQGLVVQPLLKALGATRNSRRFCFKFPDPCP